MRAERKTIGELLQPQTQFLVPVFQRGYVWDVPSVRRLWSDLNAVALGENDRHFLGTFVVAPTPVSGGFKKRFVVDGQQRLMTLSILFCALRDHVRSRDARPADKLETLYLLNQDDGGRERRKIVPIDPDDDDEWRAIVLRSARAGGDNNIGRAYREFLRQLVRQDDEDGLDVSMLEQAVAYQCEVVEVEAEPGDNLHRIFDSLNHGGKPLMQADLVRNYMFMRLRNTWRAVYDQHWEPLQRLLNRQQIEEVVTANLVLHGLTGVNKDNVYEKYQQLMRGLTEEQVAEWAAELHQQAMVYRIMLVPSEGRDPQVREAVRRLVGWTLRAGHTLILAILASHDTGKLSALEAVKALGVVESYLVRRALVGIATNNNSRNLAQTARDLARAVPTAETIAARLVQSPGGFPTDDQVREGVADTNAYTPNGNNAVARYVLRHIEAQLEPRELLDLSDSAYTIEHLLPQSLTDAWRASLEREAGGGDGDEIHPDLVNKLGNLTLTAYNQELGSKPWDEKRDILARSSLAMNRDIAANRTWGRQQIVERGAALADRIVATWSGPPAAPVVAAAPPRAAVRKAPARGRRMSPKDRQWQQLPQILALIPAGRWTSYADIAEVLGVHPAMVGQHMNETDFSTAHRVLRLRQPVPPAANRGVLEEEGLRFDRHGRAEAGQRFTAEDLRAGLDDATEP